MRYREELEKGLERELEIATEARSKGLDPDTKVEIQITDGMAERVEAITSIKGISRRIKELEGKEREEIALIIGMDIAEGRLGEGKRGVEAIELAVRAAVAIITEGVVAAPIEGISRIEASRDGDSQYIRIFYSGPIRSAGGTAQAISVLVADYVRRKEGFSEYKPRKEEIERYISEVSAYRRNKATQYSPSDEEIRLIVENCPVCIDGDATEEEEVEYKNLERVSTDRIRGGMCLVLSDGIAMKAAKIKKYIEKFGIEGWDWLDELIKKRRSVEKKEDFLGDVIAGRPVFSHPSKGFRLRYGRARNTGLSAVGLHPATMEILGFTAVGTQIKIELPGKAACVAPVDSIEGPTVKIGEDVVRLNSSDEARKLKDRITEIIDLGEILIDYGDFLENNHVLLQGAYSHEWWIKELERLSITITDGIPAQKEAISLSETHDVPLHPAYTCLWHDITPEDKAYLSDVITRKGHLDLENERLILPMDQRLKQILEKLLVPHRVRSESGDKKILIDEPLPLIKPLGIEGDENGRLKREGLEAWIHDAYRLKIRRKAPTRIGARMGRPEKSKERRMKPAVHSIFAVGEKGGRYRSLKEAMRNSEDISEYVKNAMDNLSLSRNQMKDVKCVRGLISSSKISERIEKGILRAKHDVFVFKDGTIRYDLTNMPLTHFRPSEIGIDVETAKKLGYTHDIFHEELKSDDQLLELKQQDIIVSEDAIDYLLRVANFIDELLERFYGMKPYYNASKKEDMIGKLVIAIAPHTSTGVLCRIIGWTKASVCWAHPFFHAAKRRNCDGDEDSLMLLLDGLLNFSVYFLPEKIGGRMDAPMFLTKWINPMEVDKEVHNLSVGREYPLEFFEATVIGKKPDEVKMEIASSKISSLSSEEVELSGCYGFSFTHDVSDICDAPIISLYRTSEDMEKKIKMQLDLSRKIRAVDEKDVVERIIDHHFIPDIRGNLRAFCTQKMRCSMCNTKYRRIPLTGKCSECGGRLLPTVHASSVRKYLDISLRMANEYKISRYTIQRLLLIEKEIESLFTSPEGEKQKMISEYMR